MTILERFGLRARLELYEMISVVGVLFAVFGSMMGWITVEATADAAAQHDDIEAGTTVFTGLDLSWGEITLYLAIFVAVVLGLVLWRYRAPGRFTGLLVMLVGLVTAGVAVIGIVLTGMIYSPAGELEGVSVGVGLGIFVTLLGALFMLSGGILRLAAGPPSSGDPGSTQ